MGQFITNKKYPTLEQANKERANIEEKRKNSYQTIKKIDNNITYASQQFFKGRDRKRVKIQGSIFNELY